MKRRLDNPSSRAVGASGARYGFHVPRPTSPPARPPLNSPLPTIGALLAAVALGAAGCGGEARARNEFDRIAAIPTGDELVEVELGAFVVPVPLALDPSTPGSERVNIVEIKVELFAVVEPSQRKQVKTLLKRHEGRIRDSVIRVCRNTTRDDLVEGQKSTLKTRLLDAVRPHLGGKVVRRVGLRHVGLEGL